VLDSCRWLEQDGFEVTYLPVQQNGLIDLEELKATIRPDTVLVSVMGVNNEIGVVQPLKEIGQMCRANKTFFHSDNAQMLGKVGVGLPRCVHDRRSCQWTPNLAAPHRRERYADRCHVHVVA